MFILQIAMSRIFSTRFILMGILQYYAFCVAHKRPRKFKFNIQNYYFFFIQNLKSFNGKIRFICMYNILFYQMIITYKLSNISLIFYDTVIIPQCNDLLRICFYVRFHIKLLRLVNFYLYISIYSSSNSIFSATADVFVSAFKDDQFVIRKRICAFTLKYG